MSIVIKKLNKIVSCILVFIFVFLNFTYAYEVPKISSGIINNTTNNFGPRVLEKFKTAMLTGDSYADYFIKYENNRDLKLQYSAHPGQTIFQNEPLLEYAFTNDVQVAILSIGVNDHYRQTVPYKFESLLHRMMRNAVMHNKIVILHTYMPHFFPLINGNKYTLKYYDGALRHLAETYDNVYYVDTSDLDAKKYILEDNMHYGKEYYDILYSRIFEILYAIEHMND